MDARPQPLLGRRAPGLMRTFSVTQVRFMNLKNRSPARFSAGVRAGSRPSAADDRKAGPATTGYGRVDGPASLRSTTCQSMLEKQASTYFARSDGA